MPTEHQRLDGATDDEVVVNEGLGARAVISNGRLMKVETTRPSLESKMLGPDPSVRDWVASLLHQRGVQGDYQI